jgi:hypothetical protein
MSDGTFIIFSKSRAIYQGGEDKPQAITKRSRRTLKLGVEILYPIFKEAAEYIKDDAFWHKILEDASRGHFQKMYRYTNGTLSFKQKSKVYSKEICQDDPELCLKNVQDFMQSNGCYSNKDHQIHLQEIEQKRNEASQTILEWKNIKSRKTKRLLISRYVAYLGEHYTLNKLELSQLVYVVRSANSIGLINNDTINMQNNQIVDIDILCFDTETRDFFIDPDAKPPKTSKSTKKVSKDEDDEEDEEELVPDKTIVSKSRMADWTKFTTILGKRMAAHNKLEELLDKNLSDEEEEEIETPKVKKIAVKPKRNK